MSGRGCGVIGWVFRCGRAQYGRRGWGIKKMTTGAVSGHHLFLDEYSIAVLVSPWLHRLGVAKIVFLLKVIIGSILLVVTIIRG